MIGRIKNLCKTTRSFLESGKELNKLDPNLKEQWIEIIGGDQHFTKFESSMGSLFFESVLDEIATDKNFFILTENKDEFMEVLKDKFNDPTDKRCQVGQVYSHIEKNKYKNAEKFRKNVNSVFLILDKKNLTITETDRENYMEIASEECGDLVEFRSVAKPDVKLKLCQEFHYRTDRIPANGRILGTGVMVASDKIATAAHVVEAADVAGVDPLDLIFVGSHFVYGKKNRIEVNKNYMYKLKQEKIKINNQMVNGVSGDAAWFTVVPYDETRRTAQRNVTGINTRSVSVKIPQLKLMQKEQPVYALGHGFGVPMKLSFGGSMEYLGNDGWMGCNLDIFPGNSGSPVFHANTHELLGIISGPDNLWRKEVKNGNCMNVIVNNDGVQSVQTTQIKTLIDKIKKT